MLCYLQNEQKGGKSKEKNTKDISVLVKTTYSKLAYWYRIGLD